MCGERIGRAMWKRGDHLLFCAVLPWKQNQWLDDLERSTPLLVLWLGLCSSCVLPFSTRFDYEGLEPKTTYYIMRDLEALVTDKSFISQQFAVGSHIYTVAKTDSFEYVDPVDGTVTKKQVLDSPEQAIRQSWGPKCARVGEVFKDDSLWALHYTGESPAAMREESPWGRVLI